MNKTTITTRKEKIISFLWQHLLLLLSLNLMTLGVVLCIKSSLGSSVISSLPFVFSLAGATSQVPAWTIGGYTIAMNFVLVFCQILILRRKFDPMQLFQLVIGFVFGWLIDLNMWLTSGLACTTLPAQLLAQFVGCTIMGIGIAFEVRCGSVTMPGEGISIAVSQVVGRPFAKVKILIDTVLVLLAIAGCYLFFGHWLWNVIGLGTLFAMVYVGLVVKFAAPCLGWFDRLLDYTPGFRRYLFGLARLLYRRGNVKN
ncbi:DUF6198 family protein [uncultured Rikenella sp.]|uniref:YczE/YyaS/YitT family protein n=1 Tax=uncultured Rikenella sp. TaxID=368003 RepID=UPI002601E23E|nr:DUF6198 family protein [uncultured Rikenella sp.]